MAAPHAFVVAQHVFIDPMPSHVVTVLVEVQAVTVRVGDPTADVQRVIPVVPQRLMRRESQHVVVVRPLPSARNLLRIEPSAV